MWPFSGAGQACSIVLDFHAISVVSLRRTQRLKLVGTTSDLLDSSQCTMRGSLLIPSVNVDAPRVLTANWLVNWGESENVRSRTHNFWFAGQTRDERWKFRHLGAARSNMKYRVKAVGACNVHHALRRNTAALHVCVCVFVLENRMLLRT